MSIGVEFVLGTKQTLKRNLTKASSKPDTYYMLE